MAAWRGDPPGNAVRRDAAASGKRHNDAGARQAPSLRDRRFFLTDGVKALVRGPTTHGGSFLAFEKNRSVGMVLFGRKML